MYFIKIGRFMPNQFALILLFLVTIMASLAITGTTSWTTVAELMRPNASAIITDLDRMDEPKPTVTESCYYQAYSLYHLNGPATTPAQKEQVRTAFYSAKGNAQAIGHHIGMMVGMRLLDRDSPSRLTYYKASACAIKKADQWGVTDSQMIVGALRVIGSQQRIAAAQQSLFDQNTATGDVDLNNLQAEQQLFSENTKGFVRMTKAIADMRCDISDDEADAIHLNFVQQQFFGNLSSSTVSAINELNNSCAQHFHEIDRAGKAKPSH